MAEGGLEPLSQSQSLVATSTGADQSSALVCDTVTNYGERMSACPTVRQQQTVVTSDGLAADARPVTRPAEQPGNNSQRTVISAAQLQTMLNSGQRIVSMGTNARGNKVVRVVPCSISQSDVANNNVQTSSGSLQTPASVPGNRPEESNVKPFNVKVSIH